MLSKDTAYKAQSLYNQLDSWNETLCEVMGFEKFSLHADNGWMTLPVDKDWAVNYFKKHYIEKWNAAAAELRALGFDPGAPLE